LVSILTAKLTANRKNFYGRTKTKSVDAELKDDAQQVAAMAEDCSHVEQNVALLLAGRIPGQHLRQFPFEVGDLGLPLPFWQHHQLVPDQRNVHYQASFTKPCHLIV
jgi:hypothetical protein